MSSSHRPRNLAEAARFQGGQGTENTKRQKLSAELHQVAGAETSYGPIVKTLTLHGHDIPYVCPFALLWSMASVSPGFSALLHSRIGGSVGRVCLYVDEVVPGNNLRPDHARAFYSFFWLFLEYPDWLRSSAFGWHDLCVLKVSVVNEIPGGISAVTAAMLRVFWGTAEGAYNLFRLGVRVAGPQAPYVLRASFGVFLVDERTEKYITGVKGSSDSKPCMSCRNVVGRIDVAHVVPPFRHFSAPGLAGCDRQTTATFNTDWDYLRAQSGVATVAQFGEMQQCLGLTFNVHALPCTDMRDVARIPETRYCDWMHNLCASGGVFQYQVNQFCLALETAGLSKARLDEFQQTCRQPHSSSNLRRSFFQDRVAPLPTNHIKAFASEILAVAVIIHLFCDLVLAPTGVMMEHVSLARAMSTILQILRLGDGAVRHARLLADLLLAYHNDFLALMPQCCKPKLHYVHHTPEQLEMHAVNLSCFGPERKHKNNKQALAYIFRHMEVALVARNVDDMMHRCQDPTTFDPERITGPLRAVVATDVAYAMVEQRFGQASADRAQRAISAKGKCGDLHRKDVVMWGDRTDFKLGSVVCFVSGVHVNIIVVVEKFVAHGGRWHKAVALHDIIDLSAILCPLTYFQHEDGFISPHIPSYV